MPILTLLFATQCQQVKESSFEFYHAKAQRRQGRKGEEKEEGKGCCMLDCEPNLIA